MLITVTVAILVVMSIALARAILGPSLYDRILAINMFGTKTVLLLSVLSVVAGRGDMVDIAFIYALINFVGIIAVLRFFEFTGENNGELED
jgi:multicomponent Na+:H+ antiporter subunit F